MITFETLKNRVMAVLGGSAEKREMLFGSGISFGIRMVGMGLSYVSLLLIARLYGAEIIGGLSLAIAVYSIFSLFGPNGAKDAIVRFVATSSVGQHNNFKQTYYRLTLFFMGLAVMMGIILFLGSNLIACQFFHKPELVGSVKLMACAVPIGALLFINSATLRGLKRIGAANSVAILVQVSANMLFVIILYYFMGKKLNSVVVAYLISLAFSALVGWLLIIRDRHWVNSNHKNKLSWSKIWDISAPMFISSGMIILFSWADTFMLGVYCQTDVVGVYRIAFKLSTLVGFSINAVGGIASAQFAETYAKGNNTKLKKLVEHSAGLIFWTAMPIMLVLLMFSKYILAMFGEQFTEGLLCLIILVIAQGFNAICGLVGILLNTCGGQKQFRNAILVTSVLNIGLNLWLIPIYGAAGAAIATAASVVLGNVLSSWAVYRRFGFWAGYRFGL